ncbi:hypothetical protein BH09DEP1_BH09DEP1_7580 [soil metagenome]
MKHISVLLIILIGSANLINGGIIWSRPKPASEEKKDNPKIEKIKYEISAYLGNIVYATIITRPELEKHIQSLISRDTQNPKVFPVLNAFMSDEANQDNSTLLSELDTAVRLLLKKHIDGKCIEMKLS